MAIGILQKNVSSGGTGPTEISVREVTNIVIAMPDASPLRKSSADLVLVGDSAADLLMINNAISSLSADGGGVIQFTEGTLNTNTVTQVSSGIYSAINLLGGVRLRGAGADLTKFVHVVPNSTSTISSFIFSSSSDASQLQEISNFSITIDITSVTNIVSSVAAVSSPTNTLDCRAISVSSFGGNTTQPSPNTKLFGIESAKDVSDIRVTMNGVGWPVSGINNVLNAIDSSVNISANVIGPSGFVRDVIGFYAPLANLENCFVDASTHSSALFPNSYQPTRVFAIEALNATDCNVNMHFTDYIPLTFISFRSFVTSCFTRCESNIDFSGEYQTATMSSPPAYSVFNVSGSGSKLIGCKSVMSGVLDLLVNATTGVSSIIRMNHFVTIGSASISLEGCSVLLDSLQIMTGPFMLFAMVGFQGSVTLGANPVDEIIWSGCDVRFNLSYNSVNPPIEAPPIFNGFTSNSSGSPSVPIQGREYGMASNCNVLVSLNTVPASVTGFLGFRQCSGCSSKIYSNVPVLAKPGDLSSCSKIGFSECYQISNCDMIARTGGESVIGYNACGLVDNSRVDMENVGSNTDQRDFIGFSGTVTNLDFDQSKTPCRCTNCYAGVVNTIADATGFLNVASADNCKSEAFGENAYGFSSSLMRSLWSNCIGYGAASTANGYGFYAKGSPTSTFIKINDCHSGSMRTLTGFNENKAIYIPDNGSTASNPQYYISDFTYDVANLSTPASAVDVTTNLVAYAAKYKGNILGINYV